MISRQDVTVPNALTVLRIIIALSAGALLMRSRQNGMLAAVLVVAASLLDFFDGWYARRYRQTTRLGVHLDPFADKVLISVIFISLAREIASPWFSLFVGIIVLREASITIYRMILHRRSGSLLAASMLGKAKTVIQCVVGCGLMFYIYVYPGRIPGNTAAVFALMAFAVFVTIDSGLRYLLPRCQDGKKRSVTERLLLYLFGFGAREA
ncbi:MAG: CDP-diacylglycerol--glycerol-3-phosphate 3-phosphatidyltransferase [Candidatus Krumholzibacteria bacterium]|nr:CDP-diacylglycerol--glycerol-3-phosphate 3-phosphatidyltransferase [Candidatus Krumholzibacteria bacterium]